MGFHRQEFWSGLPFPSPGDLLNPRTEPRSPASQVDSLVSKIEWKLGKHSHIDISKRTNFQILNFQTHAQLKILLDRISQVVLSLLLFYRHPSAQFSCMLGICCCTQGGNPQVCTTKSFLNDSAGAQNGCLHSKPFLRLGAF